MQFTTKYNPHKNCQWTIEHKLKTKARQDNTYLNPCKNKRCKSWCKLHDVSQCKTLEIYYYTATTNLCCWFKHRGGYCNLNGAEQILQRAFRWFPSFCCFSFVQYVFHLFNAHSWSFFKWRAYSAGVKKTERERERKNKYDLAVWSGG